MTNLYRIAEMGLKAGMVIEDKYSIEKIALFIMKNYIETYWISRFFVFSGLINLKSLSINW